VAARCHLGRRYLSAAGFLATAEESEAAPPARARPSGTEINSATARPTAVHSSRVSPALYC